MANLDPEWLRHWARNFHAILYGPERKYLDALIWTVEHDCDPERVLYLVAAATHPCEANSNAVHEVKRKLKEKKNRIKNIGKLIRKMQTAWQELEEEIDAIPRFFLSTSAELQSALQSANSLLVRLRKFHDTRKVPDSGLALAALCIYVRRKQEKCAYPRIADLLEAGYAAHGIDCDVDPVSLGRRVRRFKQDHPEIANGFERLTADTKPHQKMPR